LDAKTAPQGVVIASDFARQVVQARVNSALERLRKAVEGRRNIELFIASATIGVLVADGAIAPYLAKDLLTEAALDIGLNHSEIAPTIDSGLKHGAQDGAALGANPTIAFHHVRLLPPPERTGQLLAHAKGNRLGSSGNSGSRAHRRAVGRV
jgi:hypothetical protein